MAGVDPELLEMLTQNGGVRKATGVNYGKPTYADALVDIKLYWEQEFRTIKDKQGREVTSSGLAIVSPLVDIENEDKLADPEGNEWEVLKVVSVPDIEGEHYPHHREVYV